MPRAIWNGAVIAEADACEIVEGNLYFPPDALKVEFFRPSATTSFCSWKGACSYFDIVVAGQENKDAAWVYRDPKPEAANIKDRIAFWNGVKIEP